MKVGEEVTFRWYSGRLVEGAILGLQRWSRIESARGTRRYVATIRPDAIVGNEPKTPSKEDVKFQIGPARGGQLKVISAWRNPSPVGQRGC
jgi:hypothetical protein